MTDDLRTRVALALGWRLVRQPHGLDSWIAPGGTQHAEPPELTTDAALALVVASGIGQFALLFLDGTWTADINSSSSRFRDLGAGQSPDATEAVYGAWLDWREKQ